MRSWWITSRFGALFVAWVVALPSGASGQTLSQEDKARVEARLVDLVKPKGKRPIKIADGHTIFMEATARIAKIRLRGSESEYEGMITGIRSPAGIVVHPRIDEVVFEPAGNRVNVRFRYAIHADPGATGRGRVRMTLNLIERGGLANVIAKKKVSVRVRVVPNQPNADDLTADFYGYRLYSKSAGARRNALSRQGLDVSMKAMTAPPTMNRVSAAVARNVEAFLRDRRRMWIAHRHLVAAVTSRDSEISSLASTLVGQLDQPEDELAIPALAFGPLSNAAASPQPIDDTPSDDDGEFLQPTAEIPVDGPASPRPSDAEVLSPVTAYEPGSEREPDATDIPPRLDLEPEETDETDPGELALNDPVSDETAADAEVDPDDPFLLRKETPIPDHPRGLVLDDPNIAHAAAVRMAWANVEFQGSAITSVFFFEGQAALTRNIGFEFTLPTEYVDLDLDGAKSVFAAGNPLLALKYRLHLSPLLGRRPALTFRLRTAVPFSPLNRIPPTEFGAEDFTREAHFTDPYAFILEKGAVGAGVSFVWEWNILYTGLQVYTDYFYPVDGSIDQTNFLALSYGFSLGALPSSLVGFFAEARATSLIAGSSRTEVFSYFGTRGHFLKYIEPAIWIACPLSSVRNSNTYQIGAELRFSYDVHDVIRKGQRQRDTPLF